MSRRSWFFHDDETYVDTPIEEEEYIDSEIDDYEDDYEYIDDPFVTAGDEPLNTSED